MDDPPSKCPNLLQVLGCYLNQDFDLTYASAEAALQASVAEHEVAVVLAAAVELRINRPSDDGEEASRRFTNALCDYHPPGDGLTYVAWLDRVQRLLDGEPER